MGNGDPKFNQILKSLFGNRTPETRKMAFYMICIWTRFAIYSFIFLNRHKSWVPPLVFVVSAMSAILLWRNGFNGQQWWSRRFQFYISIALLVACLLTYLNKIPKCIIPTILYVSLLGGFGQSLFVKFN